MITKIFLLFLLSVSGLRAEETEPSFFTASVGLKAQSNLVRRAATLYDSYQLSPILYLGLFQDRLQFLVSSLEYRDWILSHSLRGRIKIATLSDKPLFVNSGHPQGARNSRASSLELVSTLEYFLGGYGKHLVELDFRYSQDIQKNGGIHLELIPRIPLYRFQVDSNGLAEWQPEAFLQLGWGDSDHNAYLYGSNARSSGFSHLGMGLQLAMPSKVDTSYLLFQILYYRVLSETNREGNLLEGKSDGIHANLTVALGIFK